MAWTPAGPDGRLTFQSLFDEVTVTDPGVIIAPIGMGESC